MIFNLPPKQVIKTIKLLDNVSVVGPGPAKKSFLGGTNGYQVIITGGMASCRIEASNDGINFITIIPDISASGTVEDNGTWKFVRGNVRVITGNLTISMAGVI